MARILVIDDDAAVRGAMQVLLQVEGFEVELAKDGPSGLAAAQKNVPDLVIVDRFMPGMDGRETIRALRERTPQLRIIAVSGAMAGPNAGADEGGEDSAGADFSLQKPFRPRELTAAVRQLLGLPERPR